LDGIARVIDDPSVRTVAIVGCSKNSGKTTAMNHVLSGLQGGSERVGLMSIGIDGEEADFWLGVPKPRVSVREGWLVATADKAIKGGTAQVRTMARTGAVTPLGELVLVRVERPGLLLLAGVRHKADVRVLVDLMVKHQAQKVLIDGAYQRLMAADPEVSDGVILATGAILGRTVREVAKRTRATLDRLLLPAATDKADLELLADATRHRRPAVAEKSGRIVVMPDPGAAADEAELRDALGKGDATVAVPGVLTDRVLRVLAAHRAGRVRLIVADPTRMFASAPLFNRFRERGGEVVAGRAVRLLAVTVNPFSVLGYELPEDALLTAVRAVAPDIPVFLCREKGFDG
jgi:hypothetical protein